MLQEGAGRARRGPQSTAAGPHPTVLQGSSHSAMEQIPDHISSATPTHIPYGPQPHPCPTKHSWTGWSVPWQSFNVTKILEKESLPCCPHLSPSHPLPPLGLHIFHPVSAEKCEGMENQTIPQQPCHLTTTHPLSPCSSHISSACVQLSGSPCP